MNYRLFSFTLITSVILAGCGHKDTKTNVVQQAPKAPALMAPFRYHKLIEVSPGQSYDIMSWGRGSQDAGAFMILHSDSANIKYTTTTGDLDGAIIDVYNSDMDNDGNPEILIQARSKDTTKYASIYAFEFNDNNPKANKLDFPRLSNSQRKGYRGDDNFYIKDGDLIREFPIYNGSGKDAKPSGAKRQLEYDLRNNEFTVKQLSKDSADVSSKLADNPPAKVTEKRSSGKKSSSRSKKRHRRHRG